MPSPSSHVLRTIVARDRKIRAEADNEKPSSSLLTHEQHHASRHERDCRHRPKKWTRSNNHLSTSSRPFFSSHGSFVYFDSGWASILRCASSPSDELGPVRTAAPNLTLEGQYVPKIN